MLSFLLRLEAWLEKPEPPLELPLSASQAGCFQKQSALSRSWSGECPVKSHQVSPRVWWGFIQEPHCVSLMFLDGFFCYYFYSFKRHLAHSLKFCFELTALVEALLASSRDATCLHVYSAFSYLRMKLHVTAELV